jgi:hypothetical protein
VVDSGLVERLLNAVELHDSRTLSALLDTERKLSGHKFRFFA